MQRMSLSIKEEEQLSETVKEFPVLYDKAAKDIKRRMREKQSPEVLYVKRYS